MFTILVHPNLFFMLRPTNEVLTHFGEAKLVSQHSNEYTDTFTPQAAKTTTTTTTTASKSHPTSQHAPASTRSAPKVKVIHFGLV